MYSIHKLASYTALMESAESQAT